MSRQRFRPIPCFGFLIVLLLSRPHGAPAQAPERTLPQLGRLGPTAVVRATLPDGRRVTGRFLDAGSGRLGISRESGGADTLALAELQLLEVRGRHTRTGAIAGGIGGLAAGVFFGYVIGAICDAAECHRGRAYLITIPLFGGGGAVLGATIGAALPKWTRIYP